jgi:hypothetical protein
MADRGDTKIFEIVGGQIGQQCDIDVILAKCRLISFETERSKPVRDAQCRLLFPSDRWLSMALPVQICPGTKIERSWLIEVGWR